MKVLFITNIPSPYRVDFFNELGRFCDLTVIFERRNATDRVKQWQKNEHKNYKAIFLKGVLLGNDASISLEILKYIKKYREHIIVVGMYSTPTAMLAIEYMKFKRIPFILSSDGGFIKLESKIKSKFKRHFIKQAKSYLSSGKKTSEYLEYYGADSDKIFIYPFTSIKESDILLKNNEDILIEEIKASLNIFEENIILSIGQFIYRKGFDVLIRSAKYLPKDYGIYIVGGKPTPEYINLINELGLENINFIDFKESEELKKYYLIADVFVLPTREDIWGLVINEAISMGLPIITTDKCNAGIELIRNNGFIVPVDDEEALASRIKEILCNYSMKTTMSTQSLNIAYEYTIENMVKEHIIVFQNYLNNLKF